ncbi:MAG TPA: sulfide/dihydroorotate dehydrogenase-like FAD/NAD-binding protein [Candidatus Ornithospirochaeta avicola]|uniref:Sulfide/dihydroorotate dehydrogenase-like FAD/NAD-binding protein n=1 Tax=Candidatus Ornithospirochaeta avicola TaxID=2840896 RepID=A0A9D1PVC4_9SPIO|nr:sulfide/dihydroorotate dehydrogenase-like FAD/NAD-binding protein [Candidatus Ornithospirochaeta avicola]
MYRILKKERLSAEVFRYTLYAPLIAKRRKAGQFVVVQQGGDYSERIPLTIADADEKEGNIKIVFQTVGEGTHMLARLEEGDVIENVLGPLGKPTHIEKVGKVICVGGGVGVAPLYPIAKAFKEAGNEVRIIIGARNKDLILEEEEMKALDPELIVTTDDGSAGRKALVTEPLEELLKEKADLVVAIGPAVMMKFCTKVSEKYGTKVLVSLNTIMIDGTGMCGGCRVSIGGETKFVCVDGPEFDGSLVDWDNMMKRARTFSDYEKEKHHKCHIDMQIEEGLA